MGVRASWLADAALLTGYPVIEVAGWRGRGHGDFRALETVVGHHTADGPTGDYPSLRVVRDGRADLAGPLCNQGLARSGAILIVADGVAWHAGASRWEQFSDLNDEAIGIEAESVGSRDDWTPAQRDCYPRLVAADLYYMRRTADRFCGHLECALPAGRKIDPAFWNLDAFRAQVAWYLADPLARIPRFAAPQGAPAQPLTPEEDLMYIKCQPDENQPVWVAILAGSMFVQIVTEGELKSAEGQIARGATEQWVEKATWDDLDRRSHALCDNPRPVVMQQSAVQA